MLILLLLGTILCAAEASNCTTALFEEFGDNGTEHAEVTLKSTKGKFLLGRPRDKCFVCLKPTPRHVVFTELPSEETKRWRIEGRGDKVVLIADHGEILRGKAWVDLVESEGPTELWTPERSEEDGSWSFKSHEGKWLSAHSESDAALTVPEYEKRERFWLKSWKSLSSQASGLRRVRSDAHDTYLRAHVQYDKVDMIKGPARLWERWYIQDEDDKVIFRSLNAPRRFLRDRFNGTVDLAREPLSYEKWTPLKNDDGSWSFKSAHGRFLNAHNDGTLNTVKEQSPETNFYLEFWTELVPPPSTSATSLNSPAEEVAGQRRFLSVLHGTYLCALDKQKKVKMGEQLKKQENWNIQVSNGKVLIGVNQSYPALFLLDSSDGYPYLSPTTKAWEHWTPVKNGDGSWSFQSVHGRWLSALSTDGERLSVRTKEIRDAGESFWIESTYVEEVTTTTEPPTTTTTTKPMPIGPTLPPAIAEAVLGDWCIKSTLSNCYPREEGGKYLSHPAMAETCAESKGWKIEEKNGKVALSAGPLSYLHAHHNSTVDFVEEAGRFHLWTPIANLDGTWSFESDFGTFLSWHQPDGVVVTMPHNKDCEHFLLEKYTPITAPPTTTTTPKPTTIGPTLPPAVASAVLGERCLKSASEHCRHKGQYLSLPELSSTCAKDGTWTIEESNGKVLLKGSSAYLRAHPNNTVGFNNEAEHLWTPISNADGTWSFQNEHGNYLSWYRNDGVVVTMPHNKECEHFLLETV